MTQAEFNIFRDSRGSVPGPELIAHLTGALRVLSDNPNVDDLTSLLLRAGELECALSDAATTDSDDAARTRLLTDLFAKALVDTACGSSRRQCNSKALASTALRVVESILHTGMLSVSTPEGFAFYALHPLDFADLATCATSTTTSAFVVGIRSVGTTLSAIVAARLKALGIAAERTTVRPVGHPYDRHCQFEQSQHESIRRALSRNAMFPICDEGPGRSGSSFLSVAEALERVGVARDRIVILCSHHPDASSLCAYDAAQRWSRYRCLAAGPTRLPQDAGEFVGGGEWRNRFVLDDEPWPAAWPQMERLKFLSRDGRGLFKFEGHGHYGARLRDRNQALAAAGFGAPYLGHSLGFGGHQLISGCAARPTDLTPQLLTHMADYCAWRSSQFQVQECDAGELERATCVNFTREFGGALEVLALPVERPTVCDGRMQPHKWMCTPDGNWLKLDAAMHGDDHFFPGRCDIAWDLAGIIVEWALDTAGREFLLEQYRKVGGDDASSRIAGYELAYATFRLAWSKTAAASVGDPAEEARLLRDYQRYQAVVQEPACAWKA